MQPCGCGAIGLGFTSINSSAEARIPENAVGYLNINSTTHHLSGREKENGKRRHSGCVLCGLTRKEAMGGYHK